MKTKSYNHYKLSARLTADPAVRDNGNVINFRVAHNIGATPLYLSCVIFVNKGKKNEKNVPMEKLTKGNELLLEGSLRPNTWTAKDGSTRNGIDFVVSKISEPEIVEDSAPVDEAEADAEASLQEPAPAEVPAE